MLNQINMVFLFFFIGLFGLTALVILKLQPKKSREEQRPAGSIARERCRRILENPALQAPHEDLR